MTVRNITGHSGNPIKNQFIVTKEDGVYFQSYDSLIAVKRPDGTVELDERTWDYSNTTGKYRNLFLGENIKETRAKIESGVYKLTNLNRG